MKSLLTTMALLAGLALIPPEIRAEVLGALTSDDVNAIHAAVQSQLDALAQDDAARAFDLATSEKRMQVGTPDNFLRMMKYQYTPIYRNLGVIFSMPEVLDGDPIQAVRITDGDGHVWLAIFWMQRDQDTKWKIDGCQLFETDSVSI